MYNFLLFLALYSPFQLALNPSEGVDLASIRVFILIIFALWLAQGLKNKKLIIKNTLQTWLIATFLFLNLFSVIVARNADWSLRKLLFLFSVFPLYFVVATVINNKQRAIKLIKAFVLGGTGVAIVGIIQFLAQFVIGLEATYKFWANSVIVPFLGKTFSEAVLANPSWLVNIAGKTYLRATATFPDPHMFSFYLGLLIPMTLGVAMYEKRKKRIWVAGLIILVIADLLTFSRGGYLGLASGAIFAGILFWGKFGKRYKFGVLVAGSLIGISLFFTNPISQRFYSSFNLKEGSNKGRIETWSKAMEVISDNLILGVGIGNYPSAIKPTANYREPIYAHNTYLDIAAETGIANALIWVSLLGVVGLTFYIKGRKNILFLMMAVSGVVFITHSLVETAIYSPVVLALLVSIMGISNINLEKDEEVY